MRRFAWFVVSCWALSVLYGCGSSGDLADGDDALVFRVEGISGEGLEQADSVRPGSADVDVLQNLCVTSGGTGGGGGQTQISLEPFTQTVFSAVFRNEQKLDLRLFELIVHFSDDRVGIGDITQAVNATVIGGRCSNDSERACATADDCLVGTQRGVCNFTSTTVNGLLLVDFLAKDSVQPRVWRQALPVRVTFRARDIMGNTYQTSAGYTVTFDNFCNCGSNELCCNTVEECQAIQQQQ